MPRISLWRNQRGADFKFIDRQVSEWFGASGTSVLLHLYVGPYAQTDPPKPVAPTTIQDVLFLENRDRKYSDQVYDIPGVYNVGDSDFDLRQFGLFLTGDTIFIEFHYHDMLHMLGRKIMSGDVLELPHRRDDAPLNGGQAMNKFYVVEDTSWASDGYSPTWYPHIWRVKCSPMTSAQEYADILDKQAKNPLGFDTGKIGDIMSTIGTSLGINDAVVEEAKANFIKRNFETRQFYVVPGDETTKQNPWIYAGDGAPPNGAILVGSGNRFPDSPTEGDYYLRTDYAPHTLFRRISGKWRIQELAYRNEWTAAHRVLLDFLDNTASSTLASGVTVQQKQALSKAVRPQADF